MSGGALHVHQATIGELQTAASTVLAPLAVTAPRAGAGTGVGTGAGAEAPAFRADIDAAAVGRVAVARIRGSGHLVQRSARAISSTDPELLKITLHRSPEPAAADQGGTQSRAHSGDFVVFDSDPSLCVDSVAAAHGISARQLHRLFHRTGAPFAAWLRGERLDRIRRDLLDPAHDGRTAAAVAARWGLHDPRTWPGPSSPSTAQRPATCAWKGDDGNGDSRGRIRRSARPGRHSGGWISGVQRAQPWPAVRGSRTGVRTVGAWPCILSDP